jgi:hypothetical protein
MRTRGGLGVPAVNRGLCRAERYAETTRSVGTVKAWPVATELSSRHPRLTIWAAQTGGLARRPRLLRADNRASDMLVHVTDSAVIPDLVGSLLRSDCVVTPVDRHTCEVLHMHATDEREARTELWFFLRAWQHRHVGVEAVLIS